jgi:hypothetical protein
MKSYWLSFGNQDPRTYTALGSSVIFIQFFNQLGQTLAPPGITEVFTGSGAYKFDYSVGYSTSIFFLVDGGATLNSSVRYVRGVLDPVDTLDISVGFTNSSFGDTSASPGDLFGYLKRQREWLEGTQSFIKSSGAWSIYNRGASTLLGIKTITNDSTGVTAIP